MAKFVAEFAISFRLWWSLFLVKVQAFAVNGSEGNSDRVCDFRFSGCIRVCFV